MIVVLDTNIWMQNLYLRSATGVAVRFFLFRSNTCLALPEVVRLEVQEHLNRDLRGYIDKIRDSHTRLLAIFGELPEVILPSSERIAEKASGIFSGLGLDVIDIPFSIESAHQSFMKTIKKQPPSDRSQQFKDGLLWADCVALLEKDDVTLVSDDKAFYEDHDHSKGLSRLLASECANSKNNIRILYRLTDLLDELREDVSIDKEALAKCYMEGTEGRSAQEMVARNGFQLQKLSNANISIFATESIRRLAIEYDMTFDCIDISDLSRENACLKIRGDGYYYPAEHTFEGLSPLETEITFKDEFGELQRRAGVYLRVGTAYFGHASVTHVVRHELNRSRQRD